MSLLSTAAPQAGFEQVEGSSITTAGVGMTHRLQVTADGNRLIVFWNGEFVFHWDDENLCLHAVVNLSYVSACPANSLQ